MSKIDKLDIIEALLGEIYPPQSFSRGEVICSLAWIPGDYTTALPSILRGPNGRTLAVNAFNAGSSREEVKKALCEFVDRMYDTLEDIGVK
jgi:hypothetical protein